MQDWDRNKVLNSIASAGISSIEAESVTNLVEAWAEKTNTNRVIVSSDIRAKVIEILKVVDENAAASFANFRKD